jgi:hypothetical protein
MQNKYLEEEGIENRGLVFLETFELFVRENGGRNGVYPFDIPMIVDFFGKSDYKKRHVYNGNEVTQYAYLFNNHSRKDWACIISSDGENVTSIGYIETKSMVFGGWNLVE